MRLYIFRHGITFQTKNNIAYTDETVESSPILEEAKPSLIKLGSHLQSVVTDANYTSPFLRCIQTVEIVAEVSGKNFLPLDLLGEYADWKESFQEFHIRMRKLIEYLNSQKLESAAICTHGGVISALKYLLVKGNYEPQDVTDYPSPGVLTIIENKNIEVVDFNP